jgi:hypothetical protein
MIVTKSVSEIKYWTISTSHLAEKLGKSKRNTFEINYKKINKKKNFSVLVIYYCSFKKTIYALIMKKVYTENYTL